MEPDRTTGKPRAVPYFQGSRPVGMGDPTLSMFVEDIHLGIMPISHEARKQRLKAELVGQDESRAIAEQLLADAARYERRELPEIVCDAIDNIAQGLAWEGRACYEILRDPQGTPNLHGFTSRSLFRLGRKYVQVVPRADRAFWQKSCVVLPSSDVWCVEIPPVLGGSRGHRKLIRRLRSFRHLGPDFWARDLEHGTPDRSFPIMEYVKRAEIYSRQVTRDWGWNGRDWSQKWYTEYFAFQRLIRFRRAQAILREHIIDEFNALLTRLSIGCQLRIGGIPRTPEIESVGQGLADGLLSFAEVSERLNMH